MKAKNNFPFRTISPLVKRINFAKINPSNFAIPSLKGVQVHAYSQFINSELEELIKSYFPIYSTSGNIELHFVKLILKDPEITEYKAWEESKTYCAAIYVQLKMINHETGEVKTTTGKPGDSHIFFGEIPLMTKKENFLINGIEKFVISQIVRSPGPYIIPKTQIKLSNSRKKHLEGIVCELLPSKGSLILFFLDEINDHIKILARNNSGDNALQFNITSMMKALGVTTEQIQSSFKHNHHIQNTLDVDKFNIYSILKDKTIKELLYEILATNNIEEFLEEHSSRIDYTLCRLLCEFSEKYWTRLEAQQKKLDHLFNEKNNELFFEANQEYNAILEEANDLLEHICIEKAAWHFISELNISYKITQVPATSFQELLWFYFFQNKIYDLSDAGRYKTNNKFQVSNWLLNHYLAQDIKDIDGNVVFATKTYMDKEKVDEFKALAKANKLDILFKLPLKHIPENFKDHLDYHHLSYEKILIYKSLNIDEQQIIELFGVPQHIKQKTLMVNDLFAIAAALVNIQNNIGTYDDIDHLGNKRLRLINKLLSSRIQLAMLRIERFILEKINNVETKISHVGLKSGDDSKEKLTIKLLINTKPFQIVIKEFFNSHQLTQFIDQQNPLSELTNKRRISAMGPGGIKREDPNLNTRDVHYSYYGRICPIETPEGINIGLIMSLASYTKINEYGFLITPYFIVKDSKITDEVKWLTALQEDDYVIAEATTLRDANNTLIEPINARYQSSMENFSAKDVDYIDIAAQQVVSISAALIPFLENDDANRTLMGANMQRQATPLLKAFAPIVGTGFEYHIAENSGLNYVAKGNGIVEYVDGKKIIVKYDDPILGTETFQLTKFKRFNQGTCNNQVSIVTVGERFVHKQPLIDGAAMQNGELALGQNILVAFTTWKGYNYEDAIILSSRLVTEDTFTSIHIDEYTMECLRTKNGDEEITRQIPNIPDDDKKYLDEDGIIMIGAEVKEGDVLIGKVSPKGQVEQTSEEKLLQAIFSEKIKSVRDSSLKVPLGGEGIVAQVKRFSLYKGHALNDDVIEVIKVFIVQKRKIQVGDKMAGRHGNKGIVSKVVPIEDMPYLADGTPIDIMLNPLGVPSRMNIGQVLEMHLGYTTRCLAFKKLIEFYFDKTPHEELISIFGLRLSKINILMKCFGAYIKKLKINSNLTAQNQLRSIDFSIILNNAGLTIDDLNLKICTPVFSGANIDDLVDIMHHAKLQPLKNKGKMVLYNGQTGEKFEQPIAVGVMYILKLYHMVDDKIYARSVGPYSKITQQPLGGKSQNGGQRFGEMEVWALEAYGAAYNLRELLTLKSDDVQSRNSVYACIIKGKPLPKLGLPESFKLLIKKLEGLCFKINIQHGIQKEFVGYHDFIKTIKRPLISEKFATQNETEISKQINKLIHEEQEAILTEQESWDKNDRIKEIKNYFE